MTQFLGASDISDEEAQMGDVAYAAQAEGYKFIDVILNPKAKLQNPRMAGVFEIRHYLDGTDENNIPKYSFAVQGGYLDFQFNKRLRKLTGTLLDDDKKGIVSKKGYNRDFLASHFDRDLFILPDARVLDDIKKRAGLYRDIAKNRKPEPAPDPESLDKLLDDKKAEAARIQEHIELLETQQIREDVRKKTAPKINMTASEKKAVVERLKKGKEKKALERENEEPPPKIQEQPPTNIIKDLEKIDA